MNIKINHRLKDLDKYFNPENQGQSAVSLNETSERLVQVILSHPESLPEDTGLILDFFDLEDIEVFAQALGKYYTGRYLNPSQLNTVVGIIEDLEMIN